MKQVLSLLLTFVFLQTQSWALSGGPFGDATTTASLTGSYAGVLIPNDLPGGGTATSIGLFTLVQPDAGLATGAVSVFVNGTPFLGTISGVMDPKNGTLNGVIDATSTFQVLASVSSTQVVNGVPVTTTTIQPFDIFASGSIEADVAIDTETNAFTTAAATPIRIEGTATLDVFFQIAANGTPIITQTTTFEVDGFKQSDS